MVNQLMRMKKKRYEKNVNNLLEGETNNLMGSLPLVKGAKYFITSNIATKYGIVNGTEVRLRSICTNGDKNNMPQFLLVEKIHKTTNKKFKFENLDENIIPILLEDTKFNFNPTKYSKSITISRKQFPLTPAYALTAHKAQGKTLNKVIIDLSKPSKGKLDDNFVYVALSRAKKLDNVLILRDFEESVLLSKISEDLLIENHRLEAIEKNQIY